MSKIIGPVRSKYHMPHPIAITNKFTIILTQFISLYILIMSSLYPGRLVRISSLRAKSGSLYVLLLLSLGVLSVYHVHVPNTLSLPVGTLFVSVEVVIYINIRKFLVGNN